MSRSLSKSKYMNRLRRAVGSEWGSGKTTVDRGPQKGTSRLDVHSLKRQRIESDMSKIARQFQSLKRTRLATGSEITEMF